MDRFRVNQRTIGSDLIAGLTLGVESVPDAMAAGVLAGVNPIHGLYAVMLSTPVGALFTSSVFMSVQTTSAMSLVVGSTVTTRTGYGIEALFTLTLLTGTIMLTMGLLKLGFLTRFVPNSVMTGFVSGIAVLIILGQLGEFTGYSSQAGNKVFQTFDMLFNLNQINLPTLAVGVMTILLIISLENTRIKRFSMVVALLVASLTVHLFDWESVTLVSDISEIPDTLPRLVLPNFRLIPALIIPAFSLAIVGLVQGAGVSQNYTNPNGNYPDSSGDFRGQGIANLATGLLQGMPVGGSLSATALVVSSGARSRWANIFAGIVIALTLLIFGGLVSSLVMASLAGLLIVIGFRTLKLEAIVTVWKTGNIQRVVMTITFITTLIMPLQYAVFLGVALSIILYVANQSNKVAVKEWILEDGDLPLEQPAPEVLPSNQVTILIPYGSLFFAASPTFEEQLPDPNHARNAAAILHLRGRTEIDSTFLNVLIRYEETLRGNKSRLILAEVSQTIRRQFLHTGFLKVIGRENIYMCTERFGEALLRAVDDANRWIEQDSFGEGYNDKVS